eukprot:COSAG04_NODE_22705_length_350_cov_1.075697_1_plen_116_part_11
MGNPLASLRSPPQRAPRDFAKDVYLALRQGGPMADSAAALQAAIADATPADLQRKSEWDEKTWERGSNGSRHYLHRGRRTWGGKAVTKEDADYATRGLTVVHVLSRDCFDVSLLQK